MYNCQTWDSNIFAVSGQKINEKRERLIGAEDIISFTARRGIKKKGQKCRMNRKTVNKLQL